MLQRLQSEVHNLDRLLLDVDTTLGSQDPQGEVTYLKSCTHPLNQLLKSNLSLSPPPPRDYFLMYIYLFILGIMLLALVIS
jgi:hypothetical protein